jgi:hypothetical protein
MRPTTAFLVKNPCKISPSAFNDVRWPRFHTPATISTEGYHWRPTRRSDATWVSLSLASRSLAPPGYSYHGIGDFDVGQVGLGADNFSQRFTTTRVYRKLKDLGYMKIRYVEDNMLGVRFEPWHIKVSSKA